MTVSICMITYNHESYISHAVEGVLMQKCNFGFDLVIGEDFSTDKTMQICQEYASKYPEIKLLPSYTNLGIMANFIRTLNACTGKYIALCEGDDYWTDPNKLQKQVDFLEANQEYSICFHNSIQISDQNNHTERLFCEYKNGEEFDIRDAIMGIRVPTASIVLRSDYLVIPAWFSEIYNGDYAIQLLLAEKGKISYINDTMSVYRKHSGGLNRNVKQSIVRKNQIKLLHYFNFHTDFTYSSLINKKIESKFTEFVKESMRENSITRRLLFLFPIVSKAMNKFKVGVRRKQSLQDRNIFS